MLDITTTERTEQIKDRAAALGFDLVRVTNAEPFPAAERALKERIAARLMDGLDWFTAERAEVAANPRALLPAARSVIALATFYLTDAPADRTTPGDPHGRLSRYAWGDDYHEVIRRRLDALADYVRTLAPPGHEKTIPFVDTGRMVDRAVAQRSGLGWYGKNTMILTKGWGSWVFLASLVTSLELAPDPPLAANCGACVRCIEACPTGAIVAPYVLDNRRCISFLTIELRGAIPVELRPLIGNHVFGCDICQEVCPVNHVAERRLHAAGGLGRRGERLEFQPRAATGSSPALIPLLSLGEEEFRERFRHSPIKRAKRRGLLRNVCVALGNLGDPVAIPPLIHTLRAHDEPLVRGHAAWALGRLRGDVARAALEAALREEADESVRQEARCALAMLAAV
ncbi:MAG TPA: tRNA epoxyqueuosine(34) reductase QueG [Ktedonobacterales bacterium]|nr:tRNA epoxyqueuosine(34) reductase QueG [Ktedonobacterales bacterium]